MSNNTSNNNLFKNEVISVSRIKRYEQCPLSFKLHYIDKKKGGYNIALIFGSLLHAVLENLYKWAKEEEFRGIIPVDKIKNIYDEQWIKFNISGVDIYTEGLDIIKEYLAYREFDCYDILDIEHEFTAEVNGYLINGKIDVVEKINDDTIKIIDYKSSRQLFTQNEINSDLQLSVYNVVARNTWKWANNIELEFHMIRHNKIQKPSLKKTDDEHNDAIRYMIAIAKRTEDKDTNFPAKLNNYCSYCDQCDNCKEYNKIVSGDVSIYQSKTVPLNSDISKLSEYRELISSVVGVLYKRKKELDDLIKTKLEHETDVIVGELIYYVSVPESIEYPVTELIETLEKFGANKEDIVKNVMNVSKDKLKKFIEVVRKDLDVSKRAKLTAALSFIERRINDTPRLNVRRDKMNIKIDKSKIRLDKKPNRIR